MSCIPVITVTGVSVNTTSNVATLTTNAPFPDRGPFKLRFCNCNGSQADPYCVTPCTNPQAAVEFSYTPTGGTATTYATVYNCPCCKCAVPDTVKLSQIVKQAAKCGGILNGKSSYGTSGALFLTDNLPCANVSYTTTTTAAG